jgi:hypothetical protein
MVINIVHKLLYFPKYIGGHIVDAINVPSSQFQDPYTVNTASEELLLENKDKKTFIFHCGQSIQRGPYCARAFSRYLETNVPIEERPEVLVHILQQKNFIFNSFLIPQSVPVIFSFIEV